MPKAKKKKPAKTKIEEKVVSEKEVTLIQWQALERPYQKKDKDFWVTVLSVLGLIALILFFVKEWFLIIALGALVFLYYALTTVRPSKIDHRITNKGIFLDKSQRLDWSVLRRFWFSEKWGFQVLNLETWLKFPKLVSFVVPEKEKKEVKEVLDDYLPEDEPDPTFLDKFSNWIVKRFLPDSK